MKRLIRGTLTSAVVLFFVVLGSRTLVSDSSVGGRFHRSHDPAGSVTHTFTATAYCQRGTTRAGVEATRGIVAADPHELPVGSVVQIDTRAPQYTGIYTVLDTGAKVQGAQVDVFMRDCREALHFGRQPVAITLLRKGWNPKGSVSRLGR